MAFKSIKNYIKYILVIVMSTAKGEAFRNLSENCM